MRSIFLMSLLTLAVSCGQQGGSSGSKSGPSAEDDSTNRGCTLNGRAVACESIEGADGLGVDLLESMIDVQIETTDSRITFLEDKTSNSQGRRIDCLTEVKDRESYSYSLSGDNLTISNHHGKYTMKRLNDSKGILGAWAWNGYIDRGTHVIRQMTFLSKNRVIMRTSCEL